jgi:hypothetical protein
VRVYWDPGLLPLQPPCLALGVSHSTPTARALFGTTEFYAAADSFSGVNTIHTRALSKIQASSPTTPAPRVCNYSLLVANSQTLRVTSEVLLQFVLPTVSKVVHSAYFLIADTPYEVILSHTTLLSTGLGYTIYANYPPTDKSLQHSQHSQPLDFENVLANLYFPTCCLDLSVADPDHLNEYTIFSIEASDASLQEFLCRSSPYLSYRHFRRGSSTTRRYFPRHCLPWIFAPYSGRRSTLQHRIFSVSASSGISSSSSSLSSASTISP